MDHYHKTHRKEMEPTNKEIRATNEFFGEKHRRLMVTYEPQIRKRLDDVEDRLAREVLSAEEKQNLKSEKSSLEAELAPWNDREFSKVWLTNWKFQRHLYERYGGGRILCHKFGMEAFDAMRSWLKAQESKGNLKITDLEVRAEFYAHWTIATKQRTFLSQDRETIRREFLQPEWVPTRRGD